MPYLTVKLDVNFEIYCNCGEPLCKQTNVNEHIIYVEPCQRCIKEEAERIAEKLINE